MNFLNTNYYYQTVATRLANRQPCGGKNSYQYSSFKRLDRKTSSSHQLASSACKLGLSLSFMLTSQAWSHYNKTYLNYHSFNFTAKFKSHRQLVQMHITR